MAIEPQVQWTTAPPLWEEYAADPAKHTAFRQPAILRFASDDFMDEFMAVANYAPQRLGEWRVEPETWRDPAPIPKPPVPVPPFLQALNQARLEAGTLAPVRTAPVIAPAPAGTPLKLFQPAHGRFYMITASLVCRIPGLPDRIVDTSSDERVTFVVRRLYPKTPGQVPAQFNLTTCDEYAFVDGKWQKVTDAVLTTGDTLIPGEEQLPLSGASYLQADGHLRRLLTGLIPVGKRENYFGAPTSDTAASTDAQIDPREPLFQSQVFAPWQAILDLADRSAQIVTDAATDPDADPSDVEDYEDGIRDQIQTMSWYVLLDLADFLKKYVTQVWDVISGSATESSLSGNDAAQALYDALDDASYTPDGGDAMTLTEALAEVDDASARGKLETATGLYVEGSADWPDFLFQLSGDNVRTLIEPSGGDDDIGMLVKAAVKDAAPPQRTPPIPLAAQMSKNERQIGWFVIRCIYERPRCIPVILPVVSKATEPFQMAAFFDPDAPARPIRIPMPIDTTPAGLRKFDKNTAIMLSDALCGQVKRAQGMSLGDLVLSVLPWPLHKDLPSGDSGPCEDGGINIGMICSLSIPIITICALILLLIIVNLFDIIFRWIPFFISCFPLPKFNAKE
jgi:hypothetical protein